MHQIRIASKIDKTNILLFLKEQWDENHIYLKNDDLFDYDFLFGEKINFVIAVNESGQIDGTLGFIQYSLEKEGADISTVLWKARPKSGDPSLGLKLVEALVDNFGFRVVSTVGANSKTLAIYEFLGYFTGQLKHHVLINDRIAKFEILQNPFKAKAHRTSRFGRGAKLIQFWTHNELMSKFNNDNFKEYAPFKSSWYLSKRYFSHPVYKYMLFGIYYKNKIRSVIVTRQVTVGNAKILRIVDFLGDHSTFRFLSSELTKMLYNNNYEYIDIYQYGIEDKIIEKAGFLLKSDFKGLIVPNFFEPFEQSNIDINFFTTKIDNFRAFKADGDQDRPNEIHNKT